MSPLVFWCGFAVFVLSGVALIVGLCVVAGRADEHLRRWQLERLREREEADAERRADLLAAEAAFWLRGQESRR
jgi:hypothetical protein